MCDGAALQPTAQRCAAVQLAKTDELVWRDERGRTFLRTGDMGEIVRAPPVRPPEYSRVLTRAYIAEQCRREKCAPDIIAPMLFLGCCRM